MMGKKLLFAVLLAASAAPAQAQYQYLNFEFEGYTSAFLADYNTGYFRNLGVANFKLSGVFAGVLDSYNYADSSGFGAQSYRDSFFDYVEFDVLFDDAPLPNHLDGLFHKSKGTGQVLSGWDNVITTYALTPTKSRLYLSEMPPESFPFPLFEVGAFVPEPATWAMMIGGFAMAGAVMRKRAASVTFA